MKYAFPLLSAFALLLALLGCSSTVENDYKINSNLQQALNSAAIGQTAKAKFWCDQAIAVDPRALSTYVATSDKPGDQSSLTIAGVFFSVGDDVTLRAYMQQAAARFPQSWRPLQVLEMADGTLGDTTAQKSDAAKMAALLEQAIRKPGQTHDETLMLNLAQAYCDAGNLAKGAADYQAVIQAFPKDADPYNGLAYAWAVADSKPNLPQALVDAQKALIIAQRATPQGDQTQDDVDMNIAEVQDTLGWVQHQMGDNKDALANLEAVVSAEPRIAETHYHLGMVYLALQEPDAARAEFDHAVQLTPGYANAQTALAALNKSAPAPPNAPNIL